MKIINRLSRKGNVIEFNSSELFEDLRQVNKSLFYLYFSRLIDLENLEIKILKHILKKNKQIIFQSLDRRFKTKWLLTWDKYCKRLIYRDEKLRYTLIFSRGGVMIYPNNLNQKENLKLTLHFLNTLEMGGCLR